MPVLDAEPSACDAAGLQCDAQRLPSCPDRLSPLPDLDAFPPVLSPQLYHHDENTECHLLYSDPPVLSPQCWAGDEPVSPPPSVACSLLLEEETGSVPGSGDSLCPLIESEHVAPFSQDHRKRPRPAGSECSWSKRRKSARNRGSQAECKSDGDERQTSSTRLPTTPTLDGGHTSLCSRSGDASLEVLRLVPCDERRRDCQPSLSHSTSLCIEHTLIPDLSAPSSDSDWDSGLLLRLGPASVDPPAPADPVVQELDAELLHRPCTWMQDSGYESRLHTVLQPQAAGAGVGAGVGVGAVSLCGEDMDSSAFSRTLVKIVEVKH